MIDDILKQKVITHLSMYSTNVGQGGADEELSKTIDAFTRKQVASLFDYYEAEILEHTPTPERKNTYPSPAITPDQYAGNKTTGAIPTICPNCGGNVSLKTPKPDGKQFAPFYGCENWKTKNCKFSLKA